jgi:hypothetical protein
MTVHITNAAKFQGSRFRKKRGYDQLDSTERGLECVNAINNPQTETPDKTNRTPDVSEAVSLPINSRLGTGMAM